MAAAVQAIEGPPPTKKGPSIVIQIVMLLVLTGAALGIGWFAGGYLRGMVPAGAPAGATAEPAAAEGHGAPAAAEGGHGSGGGGGHGEEAAGDHGAAPAGPAQTLFNLPPMTTNLAAPSDVWARMEVSLEFTEPPASMDIVESVHQDLIAYLRTIKFHQIEGASGIQHLKTDLQERASIRTDGKVKNVYIRTLLFE